MQTPQADILARIVERKRLELEAKRPQRRSLEQSARFQAGQRRSFRAALARRAPAIIAEIKKASPSKGLLAPDFRPPRLARQYFAGGASALSVLTDRDFFQGSLDDLKNARAVAPVPVLRKDFTIDELDIIEAAAAGADAVLLIAAILDRHELERFRLLAAEYALDALVEVHDEAELDKALESGAAILGVNSRDLRTFHVSLETAERLAGRMPDNILRVAESGIHSAQDVRRLMDSGFQAFLVGEHLVRSGDPTAALRALQEA